MPKKNKSKKIDIAVLRRINKAISALDGKITETNNYKKEMEKLASEMINHEKKIKTLLVKGNSLDSSNSEVEHEGYNLVA